MGAIMVDTYLSDVKVAERYSVSRNTVWRWHREQVDFPKAVCLTPGSTRWRLSDLEIWEASRPKYKPGAC